MDVPQVGGQLGEFPFGVEPGAIPANQGAGSESMTIMPISALETQVRR